MDNRETPQPIPAFPGNAHEVRKPELVADLETTLKILKERMAAREAAKRALRESEERYRSLFLAAPLGIGLSDYSGKVLEANPALGALLGITPVKPKSTAVADFYVELGDRKRLIQRIKRDGRAEEFETPLRRMDGSVFPAMLQTIPVNLRGKEALLTIVQDLTLRKQAQHRVQGITTLLELFVARPNREAYLKSVAKLLRKWCGCHGVGIRLLDKKGQLAYAASCGLGRQVLRPSGQFCLNGGNCVCMDNFGNRLQSDSGSGFRAQVSFVCNNLCRLGSPNRPRLANENPPAPVGSPSRSAAIVPIRSGTDVIGTIHLTDRRKNRFGQEAAVFLETAASLLSEALHRFEAEESLHQSELRFRSLFEKHHAIMLLVDPATGALVDANPAAATFYGHSPDHLRSLSLGDLRISLPKAPGSSKTSSGGIWRAFKSTTLLSDGTVRWVEVHSSPVSIEGRKLVFSILHDVTEQKALERQVVEVGELERQRIGRDLHDSLGGHLTGVALLAKALTQMLATKGAAEASTAAEVLDGISEAIVRTRDIAHRLCPVEAGERSLASSLRQLAAEVCRRTGTDCRFKAGENVAIDNAEVASHLFRIAEEAVQNALRHAKAKRIEIRMGNVRSRIQLRIWNDGEPLPAKAKTSPGLGLCSMRYRAAIIGSSCEIRPALRGGTEVCCVLPGFKRKNRKLTCQN